jgi:hypothetical protein
MISILELIPKRGGVHSLTPFSSKKITVTFASTVLIHVKRAAPAGGGIVRHIGEPT